MDFTKEELEVLKGLLLTQVNEKDDVLNEMPEGEDKEEMKVFYNTVSTIYNKLNK